MATLGNSVTWRTAPFQGVSKGMKSDTHSKEGIMKRALLLAALWTLIGFAWPAPQAQASVSVGVSIGSGRHGGFSLRFASRPNVVLIPSSRVYYAPDLGTNYFFCRGDQA